MMDAVRCDDCGRDSALTAPVSLRTFCQHCGALLTTRSPGAPAAAASPDQLEIAREDGRGQPVDAEVPATPLGQPRLSRRELLVAGIGVSAGFALGWRWLRPASGASAPQRIVLAHVDDVVARIHEEGWAPIASGDGGGPAYGVVGWHPGSLTRSGQPVEEIWGPAGEDHAITSGRLGLLGLRLDASDATCRAAACADATAFAGCDGTIYDRWGDWLDGPATVGLPRVRVTIENDWVVLNLDEELPGHARADAVFDTDPRVLVLCDLREGRTTASTSG